MLLACCPALPSSAAAGISGSSARRGDGQRQPQLKRRGRVVQSLSWTRCLGDAITGINQQGAGAYSTEDAAHEALELAFSWNERLKRPVFNQAGARPSFCSGAVYAALLSALIRWDAAQPRRVISAEAWQALLPHHVRDGVGPWGCANANGPGFAVLVHRLGAGVNFTDWKLARPGDVMKIWWNDFIGADERGHLVILVRDKGDTVQFWSSNKPREGQAGGFGFRTVPKSVIRRVLFTRITNPAAFNKAPSLGEDSWLMGLMQQNVSWEDCARRCGIRP